MGGYGSTRWGSHYTRRTADESHRIAIKDLREAIQAALAGSTWRGLMSWTCGGCPSGNITYQVEQDPGGRMGVRLIYTVTPQGGKPQNFEYLSILTSTQTPWGALRWWLTCPNTKCGRRVGTLYLPGGENYFLCRHCHNLTYTSCQESHKYASVEKRYPELGSLNRLTELEAIQQQWEKTGKMPRARLRRLMKKDPAWQKQIAENLARTLEEIEHQPDPHAHYLGASEICEQAGLSADQLEALEAARLIVPDQAGRFRPKLVGWAARLAELLGAGWTIQEVKNWTRRRWSVSDPRQWPPERPLWVNISDDGRTGNE